MKFDRIVAPTIKDLFIDDLEKKILSGEMKVGEKLPSEREIAESVGISKTAVHEGLEQLSKMGFVRIVPRQGVYVDDFTVNGNFDTIFALMKQNGGRLDEKNLRSFMEMRFAIESICMRKVAEARDPEVMKNLESKFAEVEAALDGEGDVGRRVAEANFRYHHYLCAASGNTVAPLMLNAFRAPAIALWENYTKVFGPEQSVNSLRMVHNFILAGDPDAAVEHFGDITLTKESVENSMEKK